MFKKNQIQSYCFLFLLDKITILQVMKPKQVIKCSFCVATFSHRQSKSQTNSQTSVIMQRTIISVICKLYFVFVIFFINCSLYYIQQEFICTLLQNHMFSCFFHFNYHIFFLFHESKSVSHPNVSFLNENYNRIILVVQNR